MNDLTRLIELLARLDVAAYLTETASNDAGPESARPNPVSRDMDKAA